MQLATVGTTKLWPREVHPCFRWSARAARRTDDPAMSAQTARAVGYVRVSMAREEMISPELQRAAILEHCGRRGYRLLEVIEDLDATGRNFARAGIRRAIARVQAHEAAVVVVWKFSRFGRDRLGWAVNLDLVETAGGRLESATEDVDASTSTGRFTRGMLAEVAAWESERIGDQWREVGARRRLRGLPSDGRPRWGFVKIGTGDATRYEPDPELGPELAALYAAYISGWGLARLAKDLNGRGIRGGGGGAWTAGTVGDVLDRGFGAGLLARGGFWRAGKPVPLTHEPGAHSPVIDPATWEAFRARRARMASVPARSRDPRSEWAGVARCGRCGAGLICTAGRGGAGYILRCATSQDRQACAGVWIVRARLEAAVLLALSPLAAEGAPAARKLVATAKVATSQARSRSAAAGREVERLEGAYARHLERWAEQLLDDASAKRAAATLEQRLAVARDAFMNAVDAATIPPPPTAVALGSLADDWPALSLDARRAMLRTVLDRVVVVPGERTASARGHRRSTVQVWPRGGDSPLPDR